MSAHLKAQLSFCSGEPALVTSMASRNSVKSIKPLLSLSNVLKTAMQIITTFNQQRSNSFPSYRERRTPQHCLKQKSLQLELKVEIFPTCRETFTVDFLEDLLAQPAVRAVLERGRV